VRLLPKHALTIVLVFTVSVELCPNAHALKKGVLYERCKLFC